jgi:putative spermidine/putrescine transport system ATP-binding protein
MVGVVFQHYALFPHMTVAQNIRYSLKVRRWPKDKAGDRVKEVQALVRLEGLSDRYPRQLSGGQQQRVALGRAIAFGPKLLLMDEPLGALDRALRLEMQEEIRRIHRETGTTVVSVTHDQEEARALSDEIAVVHNGHLLQKGPPRALYDSPSDSFVASFFGECTLIPVDAILERLGGGRVRVSVLGTEVVGRMTAAGSENRNLCIAVRPSRIRLEPLPGDMRLAAELVDVIDLGETSRVILQRSDVGEVIVRVDSGEAQALVRGKMYTLGLSCEHMVVVPYG